MLRSRRQEGLASTNGVVPAAAQDYPSRPVTIVVGYTPGATSDLVARTIGERLNAAWGQSVIVDNRSGVSGNIAAAYVARAQPDGYTLMVGTDAMMTTNIYLYKNAPFDPVKDFAPVIYAGANIICLAVNTESPMPGPIPASCITVRPAPARRIILPASSCVRRPASTSSMSPIAAEEPRSMICSAATSRSRS